MSLCATALPAGGRFGFSKKAPSNEPRQETSGAALPELGVSAEEIGFIVLPPDNEAESNIPATADIEIPSNSNVPPTAETEDHSPMPAKATLATPSTYSRPGASNRKRKRDEYLELLHQQNANQAKIIASLEQQNATAQQQNAILQLLSDNIKQQTVSLKKQTMALEMIANAIQQTLQDANHRQAAETLLDL